MRTRRSPRNQERLYKALGAVPRARADQGGSTPPRSTTPPEDTVCPDGPSCEHPACRAERLKRGIPVPCPPGELYDEVVRRGLEHDHHESDLYLKDTPAARQLLTCYFRSLASVTRFIHQAQRTPWFDIPFAYAPFWRERCK